MTSLDIQNCLAAPSSLPDQQDQMTAAMNNIMVNFTEQWVELVQDFHLGYFMIPATVITLATLIANPVLLVCIYLSRALRQETRYLLLANTLVADSLFLILNLITVYCNNLGVQMPRQFCEVLTAATVTAYCAAIFTVTLMVMDTYAAVRWPLHYRDLLPPARTHRILLGMWVLSAVYPVSLAIVTEVRKGEDAPAKMALCLALISLGFTEGGEMVRLHVYFSVAAIICTTLILYCYIRLYMVTKTQGIWQNRYSRARVTLLAHGVLLLLYFCPGMVFTVELFLLQHKDISHGLRVWVSTSNMCVFMLLPRACAPYLFGLRYREISDTLLQRLYRGRRLSQTTEMTT